MARRALSLCAMLRDGDVIELLVNHQQWRDCSIHNQIKHTPQQGFPRFKLTKKGSREAREYISARAVLEGTTPALDTRMHTHHACAHGLSTNKTYQNIQYPHTAREVHPVGPAMPKWTPLAGCHVVMAPTSLCVYTQ